MSYVKTAIEDDAPSSSPLNFLKHNDADRRTLALKIKKTGQDSEASREIPDPQRESIDSLAKFIWSSVTVWGAWVIREQGPLLPFKCGWNFAG